jgi:hypothetical protein
MLTKLFQGVAVCLVTALLAGCQGNAAATAPAGGPTKGGISPNTARDTAPVEQTAVLHAVDVSRPSAPRERAAQNQAGVSVAAKNQHPVISNADVVLWTQRGMPEDIIIDRIEHSGTVFHLTAGEENELRDRGVSASVIRAMRDTSRR